MSFAVLLRLAFAAPALLGHTSLQASAVWRTLGLEQVLDPYILVLPVAGLLDPGID